MPGAPERCYDAPMNALPAPPYRGFWVFVDGLAVALLGLALLLPGACSAPSKEARPEPAVAGPRPPNVVFVVIDDLNTWVGFLGEHPQTRTPNLDRLAARGRVFSHAYSTAPLCNPSRSSVLTGLLPTSTGIYDNRQPLRLGLPDVVTLPLYFAAHGYRTAAAGKVFHDPDPQSWQEAQPRVHGPGPKKRPANGLVGAEASLDWAPIDAPVDATYDFQVARWGAEFIQRAGDTPYFLGVGLISPHLPWYVPREIFEHYPPSEIVLPKVLEGDLDDVPEVGRLISRRRDEHAEILAAGAWRDAVAAYLASIELADAALGRLLDAVDASPGGADTLIVVWSDHGFHLGEKQHWRKGTLWEEGVRVPLVLAGPGVLPGRTEEPVSLLEIFPTLVELAGLPPAPGLDGASLVPTWRTPEAPWDHPALSFKRRESAVRTARWRAIYYRDGGEELYDHDADPHEWHNLASDPTSAKVLEELHGRLPATRAAMAPWAEGRAEEDDG